jgi:hypothetical protein
LGKRCIRIIVNGGSFAYDIAQQDYALSAESCQSDFSFFHLSFLEIIFA